VALPVATLPLASSRSGRSIFFPYFENTANLPDVATCYFLFSPLLKSCNVTRIELIETEPYTLLKTLTEHYFQDELQNGRSAKLSLLVASKSESTLHVTVRN
jgi:hypothetical protein